MAKPSNGKISLTDTTGVEQPVSTTKEKAESTIGKVNRKIVITFEEGAFSARESQNGNLACNGRGVDQYGVRWNITTGMPLNPATNKAVKVADVDLPDFLGIPESELE